MEGLHRSGPPSKLLRSGCTTPNCPGRRAPPSPGPGESRCPRHRSAARAAPSGLQLADPSARCRRRPASRRVPASTSSGGSLE
eukprot:15478153-Alexandrium_andersonii.AAC.1